jgi:hypothetical protein
VRWELERISAGAANSQGDRRDRSANIETRLDTSRLRFCSHTCFGYNFVHVAFPTSQQVKRTKHRSTQANHE